MAEKEANMRKKKQEEEEKFNKEVEQLSIRALFLDAPKMTQEERRAKKDTY